MVNIIKRNRDPGFKAAYQLFFVITSAVSDYI